MGNKEDDIVGPPVGFGSYSGADRPRITKELPADVEQIRGILWVLVDRLGGEVKIDFKEIKDAEAAGAKSKILVSPKDSVILLSATKGPIA